MPCFLYRCVCDAVRTLLTLAFDRLAMVYGPLDMVHRDGESRQSLQVKQIWGKRVAGRQRTSHLATARDVRPQDSVQQTIAI